MRSSIPTSSRAPTPAAGAMSCSTRMSWIRSRRAKLTRQELRMARQLIESMTGPWQPSDYRDTYTDRVNDLIEAKKNDKEFQLADEAPPGTTLVDLTEALRASVEAARKTPGVKRGDRRG